MYGERIESVVEVPHLVLGSEFTKKNVPATRSNSFHDLPSYLAIIGPDMFINNNLIVDFGTDESNTAEAKTNKRPFRS